MASCQLGQHYTRPELNLPERLSKAPQNDTLTIADMQWWEMYTDTTLQQLISKTLEHNKDLLISSARVKELAAMKRIDWANLFPRIDAKAFIEKEGTNYGGDNYKNSTKQQLSSLLRGNSTCGATSVGLRTRAWRSSWEASKHSVP